MRFSKLCAFLLALLMLLSAFSACNGQESDPQDSETETSSDTQGTETESSSETDSSTETVEESSILDGVTFNNEVLNVLSWRYANITEYEEEINETSSLVEQAVFNRCDRAEARLNIKINWTTHTVESIVSVAERENGNAGTYDMFVSVSEETQKLMTRGLFSNLTQYPYFDVQHEAWSQSLLNSVTVGNKLFFVTGDISTNLVFMTSVVFFNKDLVKDLTINEKIRQNWGAADLYELVTSGKWTLDKMFTLCEDVYHDVNNNGEKDIGDRFGLNTYGVLVDNFYYCGDFCTVLKNGDSFEISPDYMNAEVVGDLLEKATTMLYDSKDAYYENGHQNTRNNFAAGRVLFSLAPASHAYGTHSLTEDLNYGALPVPKYTESQKNYACTQSFKYSMYSIASQSKNPTIASAFMQALAEESYDITRPALFDKMMKGRYAEAPEDALMWEYAVDANLFDVGRIFGSLFATESGVEGLTLTLFRDRVEMDNANWSGVLSSYAFPLMNAASGLAAQILAVPD